MTQAERPTSIEETRTPWFLAASDVDRMEKCWFIVRTDRDTILITDRGWRELAARAWFIDLDGDELRTTGKDAA